MPDAILEIKVQPRSHKNEVVGFKGNVLYLCVTAPPVDNEANKACFRILADALDIPKSSLQLIKGARARYKIIKVHGISHEEIKNKFSKEET